MSNTDKYQHFLDEIGWDEFNNVEKQYFFDDLNRIPDGRGIILRILPNKANRNNIVIKHIITGIELELPQKEIKNFKNWIETSYAHGEDGSSYYAWKEGLSKVDLDYEYDIAQKVLDILLRYFPSNYINRGVRITGKTGIFVSDFVIYGANNNIKIIIEVKRKNDFTIDDYIRLFDRLQSINSDVIFILTDGYRAISSRIGEKKYKVSILETLISEFAPKEKKDKPLYISTIRSFLLNAINSINLPINLEKEKRSTELNIKRFIRNLRLSDVRIDKKDNSVCYLTIDKEREFFQTLLGNYEGDYIFKFSSVRNLTILLDKGTIGMSSLVCMNDPGEKDYADNKINKNDSINNFEDTFIISGGKDNSDKDLTMWRLYGGDAKGVCFKFKIDKNKINKNGFFLAPVSYSSSDKIHYELEIVKNICAKPDDQTWSFDFKEWHIWQHFFKDFAYSVENEIRLVFMPNPYLPISDSIWFTDDRTNIYSEMRVFDLTKDTAFPLTLDKIILGTNFPAYPDNTRQFNRRIAMTKIRTTKENNGEIVSHCDDIDNYKS